MDVIWNTRGTGRSLSYLNLDVAVRCLETIPFPVTRYRAYRAAVLLLAAMLTAVIYPSSSTALECDSSLTPTQDALKYSLRENRCEGFYSVKNVSGATLDIIGYTKGRFNYRLNQGEIIELSLPALPDPYDVVSIKAAPFNSRIYYRMDSALARNESLTWPVKDVLLENGIEDRHINVYAEILVNRTESGGTSSILVPVIVTSSATRGNNDESLRLYLRSLEDIDYLKTEWFCEGGESDSKIDRAVYHAGKAIIVFPSAGLGGLCRLDLTAILGYRDAGGEGNVINRQQLIYLAR